MQDATLQRVLTFLENINCTPTDSILALLTTPAGGHDSQKQNLVNNTAGIFDVFSCVPDAGPAVKTWVHEAAKTVYMEQVRKLTAPRLGFHFNAKNATAKQIEGFHMGKMENTMENEAPQLCDLIGTLLTSDLDLEARRLEVPENDEESPENEETVPNDDEYWSHVDSIHPEDLYEEDTIISGEDTDNEAVDDGLTQRQRKRRRAAVLKRIAVKRVVCALRINFYLF